ncbi:MAG: HAD-IC family P-type ATPase, partial [Polyangiales bacterium]
MASWSGIKLALFGGKAPREANNALGPLASSYWASTIDALYRQLEARPDGLTSQEAAERLRTRGPNVLRQRRDLSRAGVLANQLRSPLLLLLLFAAGMSALSGEWVDAAIVSIILLVSVAIGYRREYSAQLAAAALQARLKTRTQVWRDGVIQAVPLEQIVVGDVVSLAAGSLVPADAVVIEAQDCHVSEAVLTGESFPAQKQSVPSALHAPLAVRSNCVFLGTNVRSGTARCLIVATGGATLFGGIAERLTLRPPETEFDRGIRQFGYLLTSTMLVMVLVVFAVHVVRGRPATETLLFSIALAVGLSPELLPAILSVSLARAAELMARRGVLVRRLNAIENLGSMDILCTDKTGTLTEGVVKLEGAYDAHGQSSVAVLALAACNAALETGLPSPLDDAILAEHTVDTGQLRKLAEIPFDFMRKRVSVIVGTASGAQLVMKGAFKHVVAVCTTLPDGQPLDAAALAELERRYQVWSERGMRVLALAERTLPARPSYDRGDESALTFVGFLAFADRAKAGAKEAIAALASRGVAVKLITGDNQLVARHVASVVGLRTQRLLTGADLDALQGLVDKQLLQRRHDAGPGPRLSMLETVREYASEQLDADPDAAQVRERHCRHYLALAERAEPELLTRGEAVWLPRLDAEVDNFRAALDWSLRHGNPTQGLRLAGLLAKFWEIRN